MEDLAAKADDKAVSALLAEFDEARRANDEAQILNAAAHIDRLGVTLTTILEDGDLPIVLYLHGCQPQECR
jgi:hypothetical protein